MDDITIGSVVIIHEGAVYGGLYSKTRGTSVPKAQLEPTTHTVIRIRTHYGEQEALLEEIYSWVDLKWLSLEISNTETITTSTITVPKNVAPAALGGTGHINTNSGFIVLAIIIGLAVIITSLYKQGADINYKTEKYKREAQRMGEETRERIREIAARY